MPEQRTDSGQSEKGSSIAGLRASSILTFVFLAVAAIVVAYIWGVMVGRGEMREEFVEKGVKLPASETPLQEPEPTPARDILKPQDLDYARVLRNEKARDRAKNAKSQSIPESAMQAKMENSGVPEQNGATDVEAPPAPGAPTEADKAPQATMSDYVFQLGAFKDEDTVDALRQKLEGRGLRTRMQKEGKLYLVLVLLRGTAERANEVAAIARELRLGEPIIKSRKAAPPE